jgi:hypothetical protein
VASPIGSEALKPNPALKPFTPLIGTWKTTGTHPMVPGKTFHGRTSFDWCESGAFLIMRSEIDEPEIPSGVAIYGSDDQAKTFFMIYFDERGVSRKYDITIDSKAMTWRRDDPEFSQEMTFRLAGADRVESKGRMSKKGGAWEDDLSLNYERIKP